MGKNPRKVGRNLLNSTPPQRPDTWLQEASNERLPPKMSAPMKEHRTADRAQEKRCALRATCRRRLHAVHATAQRRAGASWERSA